MIELDKRDIEAIGAQRYNRVGIKRFGAIVAGWLVVMLVTPPLLRVTPLAAQIVVLVIASVGFFYLLYRYFKKQEQYVKDLLSQCEADPELIYKEAADKKDATDWP